MAMDYLEPWQDAVLQGDVPSRTILLDEIKTNLTAVIADYADLGVANEALLTAQVATLFTGELIPSRADWDILTGVLNELAAAKEAGAAYDRFIDNLSDGLGVSDLLQIRGFIDYIQNLIPLQPGLTAILAAPTLYTLGQVAEASADENVTTVITWVKNDDAQAGSVTVTVLPTATKNEDIAHYRVAFVCGTAQLEDRLLDPRTDSLTFTQDLDWAAWFTSSDLTAGKAYLKATVTAVDKRGNVSLPFSQTVVYPASVKIPQGVDAYEVEVQCDSRNWAPVAAVPVCSATYSFQDITGTYQFRVRALDKNGTYTDWALSPARYVGFPIKVPSAPVVSWTSGTDWGRVTWDACDRAEYYEVWNGDKATYQALTDATHNYYERIEAGAPLMCGIYPLREDSYHYVTVLAGNAAGTSQTLVAIKTKKTVYTERTYWNTGFRVWNAAYTYKGQWGDLTNYGAGWRSDSKLYQGEWQDPDWGASWQWRGDGYWAHEGQDWGNNFSFLYFDYHKIRNDMQNKTIHSVAISFTRANTTNGYAVAKPLYLYNHKRTNNWSTNAPYDFTAFRPDNGQEVTQYNPLATSDDIRFGVDRGERETIDNSHTKELFQNIAFGDKTGLCIVKFYGDWFGDHTWYSDEAYMQIDPWVSVTVRTVEVV